MEINDVLQRKIKENLNNIEYHAIHLSHLIFNLETQFINEFKEADLICNEFEKITCHHYKIAKNLRSFRDLINKEFNPQPKLHVRKNEI